MSGKEGGPPIFLITGAPGAGKSSVAAGLMKRFEFGLHIPVDDIREWVVSGIAHPVPEWSEETSRQFGLARQAAVAMGGIYAAAGFAVAIDDVIFPEEARDAYEIPLAGYALHKVLLQPDVETALRRNAERTNKAFDTSALAGTTRELHAAMAEGSFQRMGWVVLDSGGMGVEGTVVEILRLCGGSAMIQPMFDSALLKAYIQTAYGYGDYRGKYWFVGMEEGGGNDPEQIARKLASWDNRGRPELTSLVSNSTRAQATWSKLIRIALAIKGEPASNAAIVEYQNSRLGRTGDETCVVELMPLPSPNAGAWLYGRYSLLPELRTRKRYMEHYARSRAEHLKARIAEHKPVAVVFYGINSWNKYWWHFIAGVELREEKIGEARYLLGANEDTVFAIAIHPTALVKGVGNAYFAGIGEAIAQRADMIRPARDAG